MIELKNVTLVCIDCTNYGEAITALRKSLMKIKPAKALFITDIQAYNPKFPFEIVKVNKINSKQEYSEFILKELYKYFDTDYVLIIQHDGYVLDDNAWDEKYLDYDYIGAPWLEKDGYNVGNGGFSLRSKKLMQICGTDDFIKPLHPEDNAICRLYRPYLEEKHGIKFATEELADKFSFELRQPIQSTFGFHADHHKPFAPTVCIKRDAALGDCVMIEPLMDYYHKKGYNVLLDIPLEFMLLYYSHHFAIWHVAKHDKRVPYKIIDLNGSYESNPKQLHLKSYYEKAGITDGEIRNPRLKLHDDTKLFDKYVVLHIDKRDQPHRNIYGVDWEKVVEYINSKGYKVFQIGQREHEEVKGAIFMHTTTISMMMRVIYGADLFIGIESGPATIAVGLNVPVVTFVGSVNPEYIFPDMSMVKIITKHSKKKPVCSLPYCWHESETTVGQDCIVDVEHPPCTKYDTYTVINTIKEVI